MQLQHLHKYRLMLSFAGSCVTWTSPLFWTHGVLCPAAEVSCMSYMQYSHKHRFPPSLASSGLVLSFGLLCPAAELSCNASCMSQVQIDALLGWQLPHLDSIAVSVFVVDGLVKLSTQPKHSQILRRQSCLASSGQVHPLLLSFGRIVCLCWFCWKCSIAFAKGSHRSKIPEFFEIISQRGGGHRFMKVFHKIPVFFERWLPERLAIYCIHCRVRYPLLSESIALGPPQLQLSLWDLFRGGATSKVK